MFNKLFGLFKPKEVPVEVQQVTGVVAVNLPESVDISGTVFTLRARLSTPLLIKAEDSVLVPLDLAIQIPEGYIGIITTNAHGLINPNGVTIITSSDISDIQLPIKNTHIQRRATINNNDIIARLCIIGAYKPVFHRVKRLTDGASK